jgi:TonB family protein
MYQTSERPTVRIAEFSAHWEGLTIGGTYPLSQFLGSGENSAVFLTSHEGRQAALKLVHVEPQKLDAQLAQWRAASKLSHPNLIRIYNTGRCELDGLPLLYIVMEYAEENLAQVVPQRALTAAEARDMMEPTLHALDYIHRQGFVHGHLKPANIMAVDDNLKLSSDGIFRGPNGGSTPGPYDAPERASGTISAAGDVWSLGMTLAEVLTQRLPPTGTGMKPPADLPEPFRTIVRHALERNAKDRWTIRDISKHLAHPEGVAAASPGGKRRVAPVGVMIVVALVVVVVAGVIFRHPDAPPPVVTPSVAAPTSAAPAKVEPAATPPPSQPPQEAPKPAETAKEKEPQPEPDKSAAAAEPVVSEDSGSPGQPMPEVTAQARRSIRGKVKVSVRVEVAPSGAVTDAKVESAGSKYFSEQALKTVRQWKFDPAVVNGSEAGQRWRVRFEFLKTGTKVQRQKLSP